MLPSTDHLFPHPHAHRRGSLRRTIEHDPIEGFGSPGDHLAAFVAEAMSSPSVPYGLLVNLGCGDGYLLERLIQRGLDPKRCIGVDSSSIKLRAARARSTLAGAALLYERAQDLSITTRSTACVVSQAISYMMPELERVIAELARILRAGGLFVWNMTHRPWPRAPNAYSSFIDILDSTPGHAARRVAALADPRVLTRPGLERLFGAEAGFEGLEIAESELSLDDSPERVWSTLAHTHEMATWPADEVTSSRERFLDAAESMRRLDGTIPCRIVERRVTCRRAPR